MDSGNTLYKKPFITAAIFFLLGIIAVVCGVIFENSSGNSNYFALIIFGIFFIVIAVVVFAVYGAMEMKFKSVINNQKLLDFMLTENVFGDISAKTGNEIKYNNKMLLFIMLAFCVVFGLLSLLLGEEGQLLFVIFICLGLFLTIIAIIITKYRVNKVNKGSRRVILSQNGAYVSGEFHTWNTPTTALLGVSYIPRDDQNVKTGYLRIEYGAITVPGPSTYSFIVPIPYELESQALEIAGILLKQR